MRQPRPHRAGITAVLLRGSIPGFASAPLANASRAGRKPGRNRGVVPVPAPFVVTAKEDEGR